MTSPKQIIADQFGASAVNRPYSGGLPPDLNEWHVYLPDAGHSIVCLLEGHCDQPPTLGDLCPVPVKTVLRQYRIEHIQGLAIPVAQAGFSYDQTYGLSILNPSDEEF